jgi:hypothetical protein
MADSYRGLLGAFPYAFRATGSWLLRSYVVAAGVAAGLVAGLVALGLVVLVADTATATGGTLTLSRAFYVVVGLLVVAPTVAPVLLAARRHRYGDGDDRYDRGMAVAGYLLLASLYVGLVVSVPASQQTPAGGALAPVVDALYALPPVAGLAPPAAGAALVAVAHRLLR